MDNKRMRTYARWVILLSIALVTTSGFAQGRRYPAPETRGAGQNIQPRSMPIAQAAHREQAKYTFVELDPLGQGLGYCYADAHAINNAGQVVVDWSDPADCNVLHASIWDKGHWKSLDAVDPNCPNLATYLTSLNDRGIAFGTYWGNCSYEPAGGVFVKSGKWFLMPDIPDFPYNQGFSMGNNGLAVGTTSDANFAVFKHWLWTGNEYRFFTFPPNWDVNDWWAGPLFINNSGRIAGQFWDNAAGGRRRAYVQDGRKRIVFDAPGNPVRTGVNGINNAGDVLVIGRYDENGRSYPANFIWRKGVFTPLPNVPFKDAVETYVYGLNDGGDISGIWIDSSDLTHTFVAFRH
jgi:uncharacterized membrane protein